METSGPLHVRWIRGADRAPFQLTSDQSVRFDGYAWSADLRELWVGFHDHWIAWDVATGQAVRQAPVPDNLRIARPSPAQLLAVEGKRESYNLPQYTPRAWSADLSRCVRERRHGSSPTLCDDKGAVINTLDGLDSPCVFSADGSLLLCRVQGGASAIVRASDGELVEMHACTLPTDRSTELLWPERDRVLINDHVPGHRDDELVCKTLDDRVLWRHRGYVRRVQVDVDGAVSAIDWTDHSVWRWDLHTGRVLAHVTKDDLPKGPLVYGEPSVAAMLEQLRFRPIVFTKTESTHTTIDDVQVVDGCITLRRHEPGGPSSWSAVDAQGQPAAIEIPGASMSTDEREAARRAYASDHDHALDDIALVELVRDPDGAFAICDVQTDGYEQRDPDAGSVWMYTSHLGRWNRREQRWQWVHRELTSQRSYTLTWDRTAILESPTNVHYDVETGHTCRAPAAPWTPPGRTFLATRDGITLALHDGTVEVYAGHSLVGGIAFPVGERASAVDVLDARSVVIGTSAGRVARVDF